MPRRKLADPPIELHLSLPSSLVKSVDERLIDPVRGKPRYAARSKLIQHLLIKWLEEKGTRTNGY